MESKNRKPNFLIFMVDEERYPPSYETEGVKLFRKKNLKSQEAMRKQGIEFHRHYAAATACTPSRASLFTGQYPSLHGVSQTTGAAKGSFDPDVFWLDANSVPTMGDYFRAGGYRTFYKGKWHVSHADIILPGSHDAIESYEVFTTKNGKNIPRPVPSVIDLYLNADRLDAYGFNGWIGPEPHGNLQQNCGTNRDPGFANQTLQVLEQLEAEHKKSPSESSPWLIVNSFVNPHDLVLFGLAWQRFGYPYTRGWVPDIPPPQTQGEKLDTKPRAQQSYVDVYPKMLMPQPAVEIYRQFYYYLQKEVDRHIMKVYDKLQSSAFCENTIVVFTSDHGELLGAHGGMHQKWHNAYEEAIHVPLIISNPVLFKEPKSAEMLTSHVDIIPTLLGLAGIDVKEAQKTLRRDHNEVRRLAGRDLSRVVTGEVNPDRVSAPLYFMTDDEPSKGLNQTNPVTGKPYHAVIEPCHVESVITMLPTAEGGQLWKYSRYFDNPQFWSNPFQSNTVTVNGKTKTKTKPVRAEFEMYNVSEDSLEEDNLVNRVSKFPELKKVQQQLEEMLHKQRAAKRVYPEPLKKYAQDVIASD
ncbi:MAG TPA: sulfatase-like hydrolase/transferase [Blastocatellia bacterium]|nr:sulfatase-like hydrolase/transferase [Blastocatellia bacterium]